MVFARVMIGRLLGAVPLVALVSIMIFVILRMLPADPLAMSLPPNATEDDVARLIAHYGFDRPLYEQYLLWIGNALTGDFGHSIHLRQSVEVLIARALPATVELVVFGLIVGLLLGVGGGLAMFSLNGRRGEFAGDLLSTAMLSIPEFLWAIFLLLFFGVAFELLPFIGRLPPDVSVPRATGFLLVDTLVSGRVETFGLALKHMLLPAFALGLGFAPLVMRVVRSSLLDIEREDYVTMARLRGLSGPRVLINYLLRNAALPTISLIGVQTAFLFGGTLLIEMVYSYPGLGNLMVEAIRSQDLPVIQAVALTYCVVVLVLNATVDATYLLLNPKLRVKPR